MQACRTKSRAGQGSCGELVPGLAVAHRALHGVDERALARILSAHLLTANASSEHTDPSLGGLKARIQVHRHKKCTGS